MKVIYKSKKTFTNYTFLGLFVYAIVKTGTPLKAMDSLKEVILRTGIDRNFRCARTKAATIIKVCFLKLAIDEMRNCSRDAQSIAIHFDSTTLNNKKIIVIVAKFYIPKRGVIVKLLDARNVTHEKAADIVDFIITAIDAAGIDKGKVHTVCADNTNTNFGGVTQKGLRNVANLLEEKLPHAIFRIGCVGHITNNAFEKALKAIINFFNMEHITSLTRNFFHQKVIVLQELSEVAKEKEHKLVKTVSYGKTRWTSANQTLQSMKHNYPVFKTFFKRKSNAVKQEDGPGESNKKLIEQKVTKEKDVHTLNEFFQNPINFTWIELLEQFSGEFRKVAQSVQGPNTSIMEGVYQMDQLTAYCRDSIKTKAAFAESSSLQNLPEEQQTFLGEKFDILLREGHEYLQKWLEPFEVYKKFNWALLDGNLELSFIKPSIEKLSEMKIILFGWTPDIVTKLQQEVTKVNYHRNRLLPCSDEKFDEKSPVEKWDAIFNCNESLPLLEKVVSVILSMSPSNSVPEGIFSELKHFWSDDKSKLNYLSVFSFLMVKFNLCKEYSLKDFKKKILENNESLLKDIRSADKYIDLKKFREDNQNEFSDLMTYFSKEFSDLVFEYPEDENHLLDLFSDE